MRDPAGAVFAALADPTRRRVVHELSKDGPLTATELAKRIPVTRQAIAKHFTSLEEAELAVGFRVGRETRYELRTDAFAEAEAWMRAIGASWDQRLTRFKEYVESAPDGAVGQGTSGKEDTMIGPVHPEMLRELQRDRRQDIDRALRGCRRAERRRGERR